MTVPKKAGNLYRDPYSDDLWGTPRSRLDVGFKAWVRGFWLRVRVSSSGLVPKQTRKWLSERIEGCLCLPLLLDGRFRVWGLGLRVFITGIIF